MQKLSRYNVIVPWRDGMYLAYNARSGALAVMNPENFATYQLVAHKLTDRPAAVFTTEEEQLLNQMNYGGFTRPEDLDELATLHDQHLMARETEEALGLVVAPSMACNMACPYCYETNKKGKMSRETADALIAFVKQRIAKCKGLSISWYGGEPLLAMDTIEYLTQAVFALQAEHTFDYTASMITNGYLLDEATVDKLRALKVATVQVTVDGPSRLHNVKRPLKNGKPSFDRILKNIAYASTRLGIGVRVNIDRSFTEDTIVEMLNEFKVAGISDRIHVYFGCLDPATEVCSNIAEDCYTFSDFSKIESNFFRVMLQHGLKVEKLPQPMSHFCMAQTKNGFVLDQDGDIYRCFNFIGDKSKTAGNIRHDIDYHHPNFLSLYQFNPFDISECTGCNILPICMGGCPARRERANELNTDVCEAWKYNLPEMLEMIALSRYRQAQPAAKE